MRQGARVKSLQEILELFLTNPQPIDRLLKLYFAARRYMGSKDRLFIKDHIFGLFRHWELVKWGVDFKPRRLILSYLIRVLKWSQQDFDQNLEMSSYAFEPLTEIEHQILFDLDTNSGPYPGYVLANVPEFQWLEFQKSFGQDYMAHAKALCGQASLDLRVNTLLTTRTQVLQQLKDLDIDATTTPYSHTGIRLSKRLNLESFLLYKSGHIDVQDEGSQLLTAFCQVQPYDNVLDLCAGAGGKTLALAALINNQGKITATDIDAKRLANIYTRLERAQVHNVEVTPWPLDKALNSFDVVLIDAPCSGSGTWRRAPDLRARWTPEDQINVLKAQAEILNMSCQWLAPNGRLIYATCSTLSSENDQQIDQFLKQHPDFTKTREIKFSPLTHQTDAFYGAELMKII
ncbi:MAG: RsmB/NOP family class I SAM-dependent RNA methyltransferase [Janthinobacterium lividum]